MAKQVLAVKEQAGQLAAVPAELVGGIQIEGESSGIKLGELKLFQGTGTEAEQYGEHPRGSFIDCLEKKNLGKSVRIAVIGGQKVYTKFIEGQKFPVYVIPATEKGRIPAADLADGSGKGGRGTAAREQVLMIVLVEGQEFPYLFRFKSTALSALSKTIMPLEDRRRLSGRFAGLYELGSKDDKGPGGEAYKRLTATDAGDLPESMRDLYVRAKAQLAAYYGKAREAAAKGEGAEVVDDGHDIPL